MNSISTVSLRQGKAQTGSSNTANVHERGDKVVVNGAKESLSSILRRYVCQCGKHTGDKLAYKFLSTNRLTASYDVLVWMFIFLRLNCESDLYMSILKEYLVKMERKNGQIQSHQSEKYKSSKKKTLRKFIQSAELWLTDEVDEDVIEKSVGALYSKGKSRENALIKIRAYLKRIGFNEYLNFIENNCSLKVKSDMSSTQTLQTKQKEPQNLASDNSEDKIQHIDPQQENTYEEIQMLGDYEFMSQMFSLSKQTHDLFEQLIQSKESNQESSKLLLRL